MTYSTAFKHGTHVAKHDIRGTQQAGQRALETKLRSLGHKLYGYWLNRHKLDLDGLVSAAYYIGMYLQYKAYYIHVGGNARTCCVWTGSANKLVNWLKNAVR